ncbi:MAG: hypothetical protein GY755_23120 [Chloroflexi bacterium]|nr:hypothetical protein [Chloroflexota bacterium]
MDTIKIHAKKLLKPYKRSSKATQIITSAKNLASLVLNSNGILDRHKNKILSEVIWYISEADGKYTTRYRSKSVISLANDRPTSVQKINHEHVYTIKNLKEEIIENPESFSTILEKVIACVVTTEEHKTLDALKDTKVGWERYKSAGIEVLDMSTFPPCILDLDRIK